MNDPMRKQYKELTDGDKAAILNVKSKGEDFLNYLNGFEGSREFSIAKTKIEEAVMWAVKGLTQ